MGTEAVQLGCSGYPCASGLERAWRTGGRHGKEDQPIFSLPSNYSYRMMSAPAQLPSPEPTDIGDIRSALETAQSLWEQGERREALQWVRRAAEAAAESGADARALTLAKMGAELRGSVDIPRTMPPPKMPDVPPPSLRGDAELVVTVVSNDGSVPAPDASLVSHRAVRVAVLPAQGNGDLRVRILSEGQIAPSDSQVALLVALEPGASPLPTR
jgi:hypothetical protein